MRQQIKQVMATVFNVPVQKISDQATPEEFTRWDSLGHLELMMALEMEFGVRISTEAMFELASLEAIERFLQEQQVSR